MGHGSWVMGHGSWVMGHGSWVMGHGSWVMGHGSWVMGHGSSDTWMRQWRWPVIVPEYVGLLDRPMIEGAMAG